MKWKFLSALAGFALIPQLLFSFGSLVLWWDIVTHGDQGGFYPNSGTLFLVGVLWFPLAIFGALTGSLGLFFARRASNSKEVIPRILRNANLVGVALAVLVSLSSAYGSQLSRIFH